MKIDGIICWGVEVGVGLNNMIDWEMETICETLPAANELTTPPGGSVGERRGKRKETTRPKQTSTPKIIWSIKNKENLKVWVRPWQPALYQDDLKLQENKVWTPDTNLDADAWPTSKWTLFFSSTYLLIRLMCVCNDSCNVTQCFSLWASNFTDLCHSCWNCIWFG